MRKFYLFSNPYFLGWSVFQRNRWSTIDRVNSSLKCNLMFGLFINGFFVHAPNNTILFYCGVVEWFFSIQIPLAALLKTSINILSSVIKPQAFLLLVYFGLYHGLPFFVRLVVWRGHIFSWASSVPLVLHETVKLHAWSNYGRSTELSSSSNPSPSTINIRNQSVMYLLNSSSLWLQFLSILIKISPSPHHCRPCKWKDSGGILIQAFVDQNEIL